jgi:hypothetical protein
MGGGKSGNLEKERAEGRLRKIQKPHPRQEKNLPPSQEQNRREGFANPCDGRLRCASVQPGFT